MPGTLKRQLDPRISLVAYLLALLPVIGIGVLAIVQLNQISLTVNNLTDNLAVEERLTDDIVNQVLLARFYAQRYVRTQSQADVDRFYEEFFKLEALLNQGRQQITSRERAEQLEQVSQTVKMYGETFENVADLVRKRQQIYAEVLDIQNQIIKDTLTALRVHITYGQDPSLFLAFNNAENAIHWMHLNTIKYLERGDDRYAVELAIGHQRAQEAFSNLETALPPNAAQIKDIAEARAAADTYYRGVQAIQADNSSLKAQLRTMQDVLEPKITRFVSEMAANIETEFESQNSLSQTLLRQARSVLVFTTLVAVIVGAALGVVNFRYVVERARSEEALRKSEERYRSLFEGVPVGLYRTTWNGQILAANSALVQMLKYPDQANLLAVNVTRLYLDPQHRRQWQTLQETQSVVRNFETQFRCYDGTDIWVRNTTRVVRDSAGRVLYHEGSLEDITERKQAEEALQDAQEILIRQEKLAMLGQLAGGVGHDLRNPLAVINSAVYYLRSVYSDADETTLETLDIIEKQVDKADAIVSDLLNFARTKKADRKPVPVSTLITAVLAEHSAPDDIQVITEVPADAAAVLVDPRQIEQVLTNLVTNAFQAMSEGGTLRVWITTGAEQVAIAIADTGCGISPENKKKLFEPLFTTKTNGIGLGLVTSKNLVEANGGIIEVESEEGQGSTFSITLPRAE